MSSIEYIKKSLKRIYDECEKAQHREDKHAIAGLAEKFNDTLELCKILNDNEGGSEIVDNIKFFEPEGTYGMWSSAQLQKIKMTTLSLIDLMGIDVEDFNRIKSIPGPKITMQQFQTQNSIQNLETAITSINTLNLSVDDRAKIENQIKEFDNEMSKGEPDKSKVKDILKRAGSISQQALLIILQYALSRGWLDKLF